MPRTAQGALTVPSSVIWDGGDEGLVFAAHHLPARGSGLVACLNRPTRLYHLPSLPPKEAAAEPAADGSADGRAAAAPAAAPAAAAEAEAKAVARCLTPSLYVAHFPRLSPDGKTLCFHAAPAPFAAHATALELRTMAWPPPPAAADGHVLLPLHRGW